jgi:hypothetical protein
MIDTTRAKVILIVGGALMFALLAWSYLTLDSSRDEAHRAVEQTTQCQAWASSIAQHRDLSPAPTWTHPDSPADELTGRIARAAHDAGLADDNIDRIEPQQAYRFGESTYELKPAELDLRNVTMRQVVGLLHLLDDGASNASASHRLELKNLRLSTSTTGADERWAAQVTLVELMNSRR